ncbi:GNAT family N-acetyltransferase [Candidatus Bipolaricaulota bacterium]|nr:GNAT family N-acetyltransferase [Candidatus Bipolaricaulota bacterium]
MSSSDGRLPAQLETERLILRSYTEEDASWYYQMSLRNRDHLRRYESGNVAMSLMSEEHTRKILGVLATYWDGGTCYFVGAFAKATGKFVAQVYVGPFNRKPVEFIIGYIADCVHEGRGYVTEAVTKTVASIFDHLGADRVRIHCDETNARSRRVAERCGFHKESSFLEEKKGPDGALHTGTTVVYLRLRSERASG